MRILIVDDDPATVDRYARCFDEAAVEAELTGGRVDAFAVERCRAAAEAPVEVDRARQADVPYALAILDLGAADRLEAARRIRAIDPDINLVIVTGERGFSPRAVARVAGPIEKIFYIAKPFEPAEVRQTAVALARRWHADRELAMARAQLRVQVLQMREQQRELAAKEARARHLAMHDSLTDAPNRLAFLHALAARAAVPGGYAVAMIDLDRFKLVNDTLGHLVGDALIGEAYTILCRTAPEGALVARLGGDEFGILFDSAGASAAVAACDRMVAACAVPHMVLGHAFRGGASAGVVVGDGRDAPTDLLRRADLALNEAKRAGRGRARAFDADMDERVRMRGRIEKGLERALQRGELSLVYQPIVAADHLTIVGFEALVRWDSPEDGAISPAVFVPIAEESNLIHALGDWVFDSALAAVGGWPGQYVSINVSPRQFRRHDFVARIAAAATRAGVPPSRVQIEVTEAAIFDEAAGAAGKLAALREIGFRIALDDFGAGHSSLHHIRTVALDCLKVDRSFVEGMGRDRASAAIVHAIVQLGRALGFGVIAEGVETTVQVQSLRMAGASHLQGFLFSPPVDAATARRMAHGRAATTITAATVPDRPHPDRVPTASAPAA